MIPPGSRRGKRDTPDSRAVRQNQCLLRRGLRSGITRKRSFASLVNSAAVGVCMVAVAADARRLLYELLRAGTVAGDRDDLLNARHRPIVKDRLLLAV
jgi:hypothetical protein